MKQLLKNFDLKAQDRIIKDIKKQGLLKNHKLKKSLIIGILDISKTGTGYLKPLNKGFKKDLLIEKKDLLNAHYKDLVLAKLKGLKKAKILKVLKRGQKSCVVISKEYAKSIMGMDIKNNQAYPIKASQKSLRELGAGVLLKISLDDFSILEILGPLSSALVDEKISLALYDKNISFSKQANLEAKAYAKSVDASLYPHYKDLRELDFCTIDPKNAKDFDDALYFDSTKRELFVAIADVSEYVNTNSALDLEARKRGFSIYFPHFVVPMLPLFLSNELCSLKENEDRLVLCFKISFDKNEKIIKEELFEAIINTKKRFSYEDFDKKIKKFSFFNPLFSLCKELRKKRLIKGLTFKNKELKLSLDENLELKNSFYSLELDSHILVEECMLLANKAAAGLFKKGIFRNHEEPEERKIKQLFLKLDLLGIQTPHNKPLIENIKDIQEKARLYKLEENIDKMIIKSLKRANYSSINKGHFALGFEKYTHFTSPIRRYSDLFIHRILKKYIKNQDYSYLLRELELICEELSIKEREVAKIEADFKARKFARWAKDHIGELFLAFVDDGKIILDDEIKGAVIELDSKNCELFSKISIQIKEVDLLEAKIRASFKGRVDV